MEIRVLAPGDEALLIDAALLFNEVDLPEKDAATLLADPTFVMVTALDDQREVMGRIYGHVLNRIDETDLFLYEVDVSDQYQRKGIGRAMIEVLKALCVERHYGEMFVMTEVSNDAGNGLYDATGAVTEGSPANVYVFHTPGE